MIQDNTKRFTNRVENYVKFRPSYPKEFVDYLYNNVFLNKVHIIADIGSGTGMFTSLMLEKGSRVIGIEPNRKMREAAEKILDEYSKFVSVEGTSENTNLEDNSVDYIICAQAFHWFDKEMCKKEFKRIIKPSGKVVLVWNNRVLDDGFSKEYEELLKRYANDYDAVNHKKITNKEFEMFFKDGIYDVVKYNIEQKFDLEGIKGRVLSSSYAPLDGEINYEPLMNGLKEIFLKYEVGGRISFKYETEGYIGEV